MKFEWDPTKNRSNEEKHGVSFEEAAVVWKATHVEIERISHSEDGEKRNATMGWIKNNLFVVIWTKRKRKTRIISVRRARKNEEKIFFEKIQNQG